MEDIPPGTTGAVLNYIESEAAYWAKPDSILLNLLAASERILLRQFPQGAQFLTNGTLLTIHAQSHVSLTTPHVIP